MENKYEKLLDMLSDVLDEASPEVDKHYDISNSIRVTVASNTDLHNLNKRDLVNNNLTGLAYFQKDIMILRSISIILFDLEELLNQMEVPKDKFLVMKLIKKNLDDFVGFIESSLDRNYLQNHYHFTSTKGFMMDSLNSAYKEIKKLERELGS
jgi:hypothetical protein